MITPYFPREAYAQARLWEQQKGMPVFTWAIEPESSEDCPNCGGNGVVYLRLAERGPFRTPPSTRAPSTFFEGGGVYRKGWYEIKESIGFQCPKCRAGRST